MNPFKAVSGRRSKGKSKPTQLEIKQEPVVKEEPDSDIDDVTRSRDDEISHTICEGPANCANDSDEVKDEIKSEEEEEVACKEEDPASCELQNDLPDVSDDDNEHEIADPIDAEPSRSTANAKKRSGKSQKPYKRSIPRNRAGRKQQKHKCHFCNRLAPFKSKLIRHLRTHTGEKPFQCDICLKSFSRKANLIRHKKTHVQFRCTKCEHGFEQESIKNDHEQLCNPAQFECDICGYKSKNKHHLESHMRTHTGERPFVCSICFKSFNQKRNLRNHSITHKNELPNACSKCDRRFVTSNDKQYHEMRCQRSLHACKQCHYKTPHKTNLNRHMQSKHGAKRSLKCGICSKEFVLQIQFNQHLSSAHGNRFPFECSKCFGGFATEGEKIAHEQSCGYRRYECYLCKQDRRSKQQLEEHMRKVHTGERIQCKVCGAGFVTKSDANRHMKNVHSLKWKSKK